MHPSLPNLSCSSSVKTALVCALHQLVTWLAIIAFLFAVNLTSSKPSHAVQDRKARVEAPNILWLVFEDMSPIIEPYGDTTVSTPNISQLAKDGVVFTNVYSTSGVCAPSRAALALGMYPSSIGANHMRTTSNTQETGLERYFAVPPAETKMLSQLMREHGYYTSNNLKTDYQFQAPKSAWHESSAFAHWKNRASGQPFFSVFNFTTTHESGLFEPYGIRHIESRHYFSDDRQKIASLPTHHSVKTGPSDTPIHISKDLKFKIPPYLPDTPIVRNDMWKMYNNLVEADKQMGAIIQQLKDNGLYDNTIIVFYADHGGPLPRQKRLIYDSGLHVPMIIKFPHSKDAGSKDERLISFVDFVPSTLGMVGAKQPEYLQGKDVFDTAFKREYIHAAADRFDGFTDTIRAVKDKRYKYIRNYRPEQPYYLPVAYREKIPTMQELLKLRDQNMLDEWQAQWFRASKDKEELYDTLNDPHELVNLASDSNYKSTLTRLSKEMDRWLQEIGDQPETSEAELIKQLWKQSSSLPVTQAVIVENERCNITLSSATVGATISYRIVPMDTHTQLEANVSFQQGDLPWNLYRGSFQIQKGEKIEALAQRLGFAESPISSNVCQYSAMDNSTLDPIKSDALDISEFYTLDGSDRAWQEVLASGDLNPLRSFSVNGSKGANVLINNALIETSDEGAHVNAIENKMMMHALGNPNIPASNFHRWSRWYQEDGNTQIFRLFKGEENTSNPRKLAARIETFIPSQTWLPTNGEVRQFNARYTIVKPEGCSAPHYCSIFQAKGNNVDHWSVMLRLDDQGALWFHPRRGFTSENNTSRTLISKNAVGRPFDLKVLDDGLDYEMFIDDQSVGKGQWQRTKEIGFRWGIYVGESPVLDDIVVLVSDVKMK